MLAFTFPELSGFLAVNHKNKVIRWLIAQRTILRTKAVKEQTRYALRVDISNNRITAMPLPKEALFPSSGASASPMNMSPSPTSAATSTFECGKDLKIVDVVFSSGKEVSSQAADIIFYARGYCDRAIIHMTDGDDQFSVYFEPFLPEVDVFEGHVQFGQRWGAGL